MNLIRYWSLRLVLRAYRWTVRWTGFVLSRVSTAGRDRKKERERDRERERERERVRKREGEG